MISSPARRIAIHQTRLAFESLAVSQGPTQALLESRQEMVLPGSSGSSAGVAAALNAKNVMNFEAFDLLSSIRQEVAEHVALLTGEPAPRGDLEGELQRLLWLTTQAGQPEENIIRLSKRFHVWSCQIRELMAPLKS